MHTFPKKYKLCGQTRIDALYHTGHRFVQWPVRVTWRSADETKVLVWAPKSLFRHAVDRNRLRRLMREAYRLEQRPDEKPIEVAFNYIDREHQSLRVIQKAIRKALNKIYGTTDNPA